MKKRIALLLSSMLLLTACSDIFEKQIEIYHDAIEALDDADEFAILMEEALNTGIEIAAVSAKATEEVVEELKEEYGAEYETMLDSIETLHSEYFARVDRMFLGYTFNFVERRTLLYRMAADRYCKAERTEELEAVKDIIERYSALSHVAGQRACDPPAKIRDDYEAARELAENCFEVAKAKIEEE